MNSPLSTREMIYLSLGAVGLYLIYRLLSKGAADLKKGLDITSPDNYANRVADHVTEGVTGEKGATIGNKLYEFFNPDAKRLRIDVITRTGDAVLGDGTVLAKGWRVEADGTLIDKNGKVLGKAS